MIYFYEEITQNLRSRRETCAFEFPMHTHLNPELLYVNEGTLQLNYPEHEYVLHSGDLAVIFPHTVHGYKTLSEALDYSLAICGIQAINSYKNTLFENHPANPVISAAELPKDIPALMNELAVSDPSNILLNKAIIYLILARVIPLLSLKPNKDAFFVNSTVRILSYVCENYRNNITLELMEKELGISKFTISRFFSSTVKISFPDYISLLRIDYAKNLLDTTDKSVLEISIESGFGSLRTFNRIFKEQTGMTPLMYKKR